MDPRQRLGELLARRATAGLDEAETRELSGLLASHPEWDNDSFDRAAAALHLALATEEEIPEELDRRLRSAGRSFAAAGDATPTGAAPAPESAPEPAPAQGAARAQAATGAGGVPSAQKGEAASLRRTGMPPWTGWLAAAAALVIALLAWWPRAQTPPAAAEMRGRLLDDAEDLVRVDWEVADDPVTTAATSGDIVWSPTSQRGYMLIRELRANDPEAFQYQLWIFDADRDPRFPVDGGVFDIPRDREQVVIPVDNKLPVERPTRFEVTVERPAGVVVSDRERVVLWAEVGAE